LAILSALVFIAWLSPLFQPPSSVAIEPEEVSTLHTPPSPKDRQFTLYARQALVQDEELVRFNVGVTVRSGVAHLWGTVPNPAMARRAGERVRQVQGLIDVRSEIRIVPAEDDILPLPTHVKIEAGGSKIEDRNDGNRRVGSDILHSRSANLDPFASTAAYRNGPSGPPAVMPSIPLPGGQADHEAEFQMMKGRMEPAKASGKLAEMVLQIRQGTERYRLIQFEIREGTVRLWNSATRGDDLFAMAQTIARLPGVERVIVENVRNSKR
jgi:hypothetical protein